MKNKFLLFLMLGMTFFAACNDDDDPEVPPTLNEIAGEYTGDKLTATIDGATAGENASVRITRESDTTATLVLNNIVPNYESFEITKAVYTTASRSSFYSKLAGEATSEAGDLKVAATAEIENGVMTLTVTTTEIEAPATGPSSLYGKSYTGDMVITVGETTAPAITQTIQITEPGNGDDTCIRLLIANFSLEDTSFGNIDLDNIQLTEGENGYTFSETGRTLNLDKIGEVTLDATGSINATTLTLNLPISAMGGLLSVGVDFEGTVDTTAE